jgi:hypothetical protein
MVQDFSNHSDFRAKVAQTLRRSPLSLSTFIGTIVGFTAYVSAVQIQTSGSG